MTTKEFKEAFLVVINELESQALKRIIIEEAVRNYFNILDDMVERSVLCYELMPVDDEFEEAEKKLRELVEVVRIAGDVVCLEMTLNKKWFDMIYSGEKKEEYRIPKKYWLNRVFKKEFVESGEWDKYHHQFLDVPKKFWKKQFTHIRFKNGYSKNSPVMVVHLCSISFDTGYEAWGAVADETYLTFSLGKVAGACL